ncbi:Nif3-like dinuclear metal center hexameric protein [Thiorhodospira sibirica]|uniref:Nif3-like dinuclear metal center hexameric protein n=1 Tax=Thiorhodospira sibirica TaxID=154347 RepID=UPI00022C288C|nr:Nif3-like dinuclear metal center hexameric protein [Thiorhodospira sibirica]
MAQIRQITDHIAELLKVSTFKDYCPNGLQVSGREEIRTLVSGVSACRALIEAAIGYQADAILVHHGFFWRGEDPCVCGIKRERLRLLLLHDINLLAYHLPLDAHPELGNNALLGQALGAVVEGSLNNEGIGLWGTLPDACEAAALEQRLSACLQRPPQWINSGPAIIRRIGWCSGAAQGHIEQAVARGLDAFISGEISEQTVHIAREAGIHYFAAGHHATERFGVQRLGEHLANTFGLQHVFVDIDNPV